MVVEFKNGQPGSITIRPQAGTTFNQSPSGQVDQGRRVATASWSSSAALTPTPPTPALATSRPSIAGLVEVRVIEDFEGQVSLGLGLNVASCYRAAVLSNPVRLVIDVRTS